MRVLGLTGSIGTGKSTAAAMLKAMRVPVFDSDAEVARLLGPGGAAVPAVRARYPDLAKPDGGIDRHGLGQRVFGDGTALAWLEAVIHPRVRQRQQRFLAIHRRLGQPVVVLDIPLLFETGAERRCDSVIVVDCPAFLQRRRVLARPGMTEARFQAVLARQMSAAAKRRRADYVVPTGLGKAVTWRHLVACLAAEAGRRGHAWGPSGYRAGDIARRKAG